MGFLRGTRALLSWKPFRQSTWLPSTYVLKVWSSMNLKSDELIPLVQGISRQEGVQGVARLLLNALSQLQSER